MDVGKGSGGMWLPVALSIISGVGWIVFILLHAAFWSHPYSLFQNIVIGLVSFLAAVGVVVVSWAVWAIRSFRDDW